MQRRPSRRTGPVTNRLVAAADEPVLADLVAHARILDALDATLRDAIPTSLARHCRLANIRGSRLIFLASSSTVAARLRLLQNALLDAANQTAGLHLDQLTIKVAPVAPVPPSDIPQQHLSNAAAAHLSSAATFLDDPELRALFLRLASLA